MDSGETDNKFNIDSVSQDDINRFENFLREAEFLAAPAEEPVKRFLELTFGRRLQTFLTKVSNAEFEPIVVRAYYEQHKEDIAEIFKNETEFILGLFQLHLMDLVMFLNNDKIVKPMLNEQSEQMQETGIPDNNNAEQVQNVVNSVKNSCQTYGDSLKDMAMYSTGIDQRQIVLAELFRQVVVEFKNMFLQIAERDKTIVKKDETIMKKDETIAEKDKTIAEKDKTIAEKDKTIVEKDKIIVQKDKTIAETNVNSLNKQLKDEKERADKLQEENKKLSEAKTNVAVAKAKVDEIEKTIKAQDKTIKVQEQSIEMQKQSMADQKAEIEKLRQESAQQQQQLEALKKTAKIKENVFNKMQQRLNRQTHEQLRNANSNANETLNINNNKGEQNEQQQ